MRAPKATPSLLPLRITVALLACVGIAMLVSGYRVYSDTSARARGFTSDPSCRPALSYSRTVPPGPAGACTVGPAIVTASSMYHGRRIHLLVTVTRDSDRRAFQLDLAGPTEETVFTYTQQNRGATVVLETLGDRAVAIATPAGTANSEDYPGSVPQSALLLVVLGAITTLLFFGLTLAPRSVLIPKRRERHV